jgi:hypothetical protein
MNANAREWGAGDREQWTPLQIKNQKSTIVTLQSPSPSASFRRSMLGVRCSMFDVRCSMFDVRCSMFDVRCSMFDVRCSMFIPSFSAFQLFSIYPIRFSDGVRIPAGQAAAAVDTRNIARPTHTHPLCFRLMAAKTENHRKIAERMRSARIQASYPAMSLAEFLAQTPKELRVSKPGGLKSPKSSDR